MLAAPADSATAAVPTDPAAAAGVNGSATADSAGDSATAERAGAVAALPDGTSLFASPTTRDHVGRVVAPVTINGKGPFRFIVDTGANHSTISLGLAQTLGLRPTEVPSVVLDGITGSAQVSFVTVDRLQAGDLILQDEPLPVVSGEFMAGADGVLGAAGFTTKSLMVDFQHNRVAISHGVTSTVRTASTKIHALRLTHGLIMLETRVGGVRVQAVVDTGSERTLGNLALRNALHPPNRLGAVVQLTSVYGATQELESGEIRPAPNIMVESLRITDAHIIYGDFHIFKVWNMNDRPALILGMDVLGTMPALGIDFEKQDVYLVGVRPQGASAWSTNQGVMADQVQKK
ncbi:MAG: retropepsin-like aspartic protease [Steroidobacteraceae bacterium]